jgi:hypothetical protein
MLGSLFNALLDALFALLSLIGLPWSWDDDEPRRRAGRSQGLAPLADFGRPFGAAPPKF